MTLEEYVKRAKMELDEFEAQWKQDHSRDPKNFPMELQEDEWKEQELAVRFKILE